MRGETTVSAGAAAAWAFVRRYENWADLVPGYQGHRAVSPRVSVWRVRGDVGVFSRIVEAEVEVVQETPSVRFTIRGLSENFHGSGTLEVTSLDAARSTLAFTLELGAGGPLAPMVNALLTGRLPAMLDAFAPALARRLEAGAAAAS